MTSHLEVWAGTGVELVALAGERMTVGRGPANDVSLPADPQVSTLHAVLEAYGAGWCVRDLGSRNGTFVGGERILSERVLRHGDELRMGRSRLVFRSAASTDIAPTDAAEPPPVLTRRERDVLVALCRPLVAAQVFSEPATLRDIAAALVVTEAAVKQHLLNLYEKFGIPPGSGRRRVLLANQALSRGAVTPADLRDI